MPELPEVETIRKGLDTKIVGLEIANILVLNPKTFQGDPEKLRDKKVLKVWRRAKIIGIDIEDGFALLIHLKMSGQLIWVKTMGSKSEDKFIGGHPTPDWVDQMPNKSTRVIFELSDGSNLYFNDQRKFGWIKLVKSGEDVAAILENLGPEPLTKEFNWEIMKERVSAHKSLPIKVAIMDQHAIAGVGNIYANEACFNAKIDPRRKVATLSDLDWKTLFIGLIKALEDGIKYGGSTRAHFVNAEGEKGMFLDFANVYSQQGNPCKVCGTIIQKITLGGRGTYFCSNCQK